MKNKLFKVSVLCVAALTIGFVATSCSDEENSVAKAPTMGVVTIVGQDDIRPGQTVQAFAPYATGGELLTEAEYSWQIDGGVLHSETDSKDGKSYFTFVAPTEVGTHKLVFKGDFRFSAALSDGNPFVVIDSEASFVVNAADFLSSCWGDSMAKTLEIYPGLTESVDGDTKYLSGNFEDEFIASIGYNVTRKFCFNKLKTPDYALYGIIDNADYTSLNVGGGVKLFLQCLSKLQKVHGMSVPTINLTDANKTVVTENVLNEDAKTYEAAVRNGDYSIVATLSNDKNSATIVIGMSGDKLIEARKFQKKGDESTIL